MKCQQDYTLILKKKGLILLSDSLDCTISTILKFLFTLFFLHGINGDFIFTLPAPCCHYSLFLVLPVFLQCWILQPLTLIVTRAGT